MEWAMKEEGKDGTLLSTPVLAEAHPPYTFPPLSAWGEGGLFMVRGLPRPSVHFTEKLSPPPRLCWRGILGVTVGVVLFKKKEGKRWWITYTSSTYTHTYPFLRDIPAT